MQSERLIDWIARDLKTGGNWRQAVGFCAIIAVLLTGSTIALFMPFAAVIDLPAEASSDRIKVSVPANLGPLDEGVEGLASRIEIVCQAARTPPLVPHKDFLRITLQKRGHNQCSKGKQLIARLQTELSIWQIAAMEMQRSGGEDSAAR